MTHIYEFDTREEWRAVTVIDNEADILSYEPKLRVLLSPNCTADEWPALYSHLTDGKPDEVQEMNEKEVTGTQSSQSSQEQVDQATKMDHSSTQSGQSQNWNSLLTVTDFLRKNDEEVEL
jgi:hypothetical protein